METEALRWFQQVADGATLTEVADIFDTTQPGVSRALARLEAQVGTPLLQKSGRLLRPTHAGAVFKRHVDGCLHALDDGMAAVGELVDPERGTVSLAFQLSLGTWLVPDLIGSFRTDYPEVRFLLQASQDALGSSRVAEGRIDLELTARPPRNPAVQWTRLFAQPLRLAVPPGHRLARRREVELADVAGDDFVMLAPHWELRALTDSLCATAGFTPRVAFEGDDLPVVLGFVAAGLGVAVVPAGTPGDPGAGTAHLMPLRDESATRDVGLAWSLERRLLPSAVRFRDHVLATMKADPPRF